ncbi:MAG: TerB family tellurite resistance protein [Dongiaceae bacterium]
MIERVLDFLTGRAAPAPTESGDELELAVAALLIEAARMDDSFDAGERTAIERLLAEKFDMPPAEVHDLVAAAEEAVRHSTQFYPFTQQICHRIEPEARAHIIEMMWEVAYADGVLDPHEDMLLRRIAGLIAVSDRERMVARKRALEKLAAKGADGGVN